MTKQRATGVATGVGIAGAVLAGLLTLAGWLIGTEVGPLRAAPLTFGALAAWAIAAVFGGLAVVGLIFDDRPADEGIGWW